MIPAVALLLSSAHAGVTADLLTGVSADGWRLSTQDDRGYALTGMAFRLRPFVGKRFGVLGDFTYARPIRGTERGREGLALGRVYDRTRGADLLVAFAVRQPLGDAWTIGGGLGPQVNILDLDDPELRRWTNISLGLGLAADLVWNPTGPLLVGVHGNAGLGGLDLIHTTGKLGTLVSGHAGLSAGVRL